MFDRKEVKRIGREAYGRNKWKAIACGLIMLSIFGTSGSGIKVSQQTQELVDKISVESPAVLVAAAIMVLVVVCLCVALFVFIFNPIEIGYARFNINAVNGKGKLADLAYGYDNNYKTSVKTVFLRNLYVILWMCLFFVPGIIKAYEYHMVTYIIADNPEISTKDAFALSKKMMKGNKWKMFLLDLSFIPLSLLGVITLGIVTELYVIPYMQLAYAAVYEKIKNVA